MLFTRQQLEAHEEGSLASYAVKSGQTRGRVHPEKPDPYRTAFQRDRDRVIHSKAFRRSKSKTQVFVAHYGDHYRSRMVHSMEVAQISRDMARTLGLNEDLAETIALTHDLGHTPFGHAGETALDEIMRSFGSRFEHNEQSLRIIEKLEYKYDDFVGLNLTYEVRDGLIKHRTPYDNPRQIDHPMPSLEAQIVNLADEIAYQNHDIDDGLRAGIFTVEQLDRIPLWQKAQAGRLRRPQAPSEDVWISMTVGALIKLMVNDAYRTTEENLEKNKIVTIDDVYRSPIFPAAFSPGMEVMKDELKTFLYKYFYQSSGVMTYNRKGQKVISALFDYYMSNFAEIPLDPRADRGELKYILVKDYIAGMTDNFATEMYRKL